MLEARPRPAEPSVVDSVVRVVEAGQRLVLDRIELLRFDLRQMVSRTLGGVVLIAAGAFVLAGAWVTLIGAVIVGLQQYLSLFASLVAVTGVTAGLGAGVIAIGIRRGRIGQSSDVGRVLPAASAATSATNGAPQP